MSRCRACRKDWPSSVRNCPDDGTSLGFETDRTVEAAQAPALDSAEYDTDTLHAGATVGEYRIDQQIGKGGMGTVYSVTHPVIGKRAAIKVISRALGQDRTQLERFVQEARAVNQIGHPNIVDIFAFGTLPDGRAYFVMEYLQGETLMARMARGGLSLGETATILDQIADALEAAHEKGVVHRDLKPENAFLVQGRGARQIVKLLDFGIAKLASASEQRLQRTRTGTMMGTPGYISPEQARGRNVDARTDIYSLGCMAFEMVIGRLPFDADNPMDMIAAHLTAPPPRPSQFWADIPPPLDNLIFAMMDKDPGRRPSMPVVRAHFLEYGGTLIGTQEALSARFAIATPPPGARAGTPLPVPASALTPAPVTSPVTLDGPTTMTAVPPATRKTKLLVLAGAAVALAAVVVVVIAASPGGQAKTEAVPTEPVVTVPAVVPAPTPVPTPAPVPVEPVVADTATPPPAPAGGTLAVTLNVDDATISLDGAVVARSVKTADLPVDRDGEHLLVITAPGRKPLRKTVSVAGGARVPLALRLERATRTTTTSDTKPDKTKDGRKDTDYTIDPFRRKPK